MARWKGEGFDTVRFTSQARHERVRLTVLICRAPHLHALAVLWQLGFTHASQPLVAF